MKVLFFISSETLGKKGHVYLRAEREMTKMKSKSNQGRLLLGFYSHLIRMIKNKKIKKMEKKKKEGKKKNKKMMMIRKDKNSKKLIESFQDNQICPSPILRKREAIEMSCNYQDQQGNKKKKLHGKRKAIEFSSSYQEQQQGNKKKVKSRISTSSSSSSSSRICPPILGKRKAIQVHVQEEQQQRNKRMIISNREEEDKEKTMIHHLPEEVLTVILIRLPLKNLLRCRSVHKYWYSLIQSPNFITTHLNHQKMMMMDQLFTTHSHHPKFLFFKHRFSNRLVIRFDDKQCEEYYSLKSPPDGLWKSVWSAQSYGLICMTAMFDYQLDYKPDTYIWNPLVQKYKTLPRSPISEGRWTALSFGFVPQLNDYVVVHIVKPPLLSAPDPNSVMIGVYSLNSNSWEVTSQDNVFLSGVSNNHHLFVDGVAYWLGTEPQMGHQVIMCFDTKSSILREISLPDWVESQDYPASSLIHPFGQSIAYFVQNRELNHFDMWVLTGNPINEFSWEKKMSVGLSEDIRPEVLGLRNNGEPILFSLFDFVSYSLDSHEAKDFVDSWDRWGNFSFYEENFAPPFSVSPFVESLVLLN